MSETLSVPDAKARLAELIDRAAAGEEIIISQDGRPMARLVPMPAKPARRPGAWAHLRGRIDDDALLEPMDEADLQAAEGRLTDGFGLSRG